ncbi:MAG: hypothetical protein H7A32_03310 [Deltaproteobacteria bacterium]|nr:hypothetical protein [Deltaproteobacteria bacterium]
MDLQNIINAQKLNVEALPKVSDKKAEDTKDNDSDKKVLKLKDFDSQETSKKTDSNTETNLENNKSEFIEKGEIYHLPKNSEAASQSQSKNLANQKNPVFLQGEGNSEQNKNKVLINWSNTLGTALKGGLFHTKEQSLALEKVQQLLLLGWADLKGKSILVGNLLQRTGSHPQEIRLAMLKVPHPDLLSELRQLAPGEKIPNELLSKLAGSDGKLQFERIAEKNSALKEAIQQREADPRMDPRFKTDFEQQNKWERSVAAQKKAKPFVYYEEGANKQNSQDQSEEVFANIYELMGLRKRYDESPKVHMLLTYTAIISILAIIMVYLWSVLSS